MGFKWTGGVARDSHGRRTAFSRHFQPTEDIGGSTARRDANHHILRPAVHLLQGVGCTVPIIFGTLDCRSKGTIPPGDNPNHPFRWRAERGRALTRIQHSQPPTGSSSKVNQSPMISKTKCYLIDRSRNRIFDLSHCLTDLNVFSIHQLNDFDG